jgi:CheY-like chemotaxis protein
VFDPFFTTKDIGVGTGLGLSHVHGFAHQAGGAVDIKSEVGRGTTVRLFLPALGDADVGTGEPEAQASMGTILIVEDDVDVAEVAVAILADCGYEVRLAYRAQGALDLLRQGEKVDLIFSDIVMPDGMNGLELAAQLTREHPDLPVLLATGYSDALNDAEGLGFQIIAKPYRSNELCNRIGAMLAAA